MRHFLPLACVLFSTLGAIAAERVVTAGGAVTEIVFALGMEGSLVGVDASSLYPESATKLPQVGYSRALSSEGILSLQPTLLLANEDDGPPTTIQQIRTAGIKTLLFPSKPELSNVEERIQKIANALGVPDKAAALIASLRMELEEAKTTHSKNGDTPRVLFVYARSGGVLNVSGTGTAAHAMIRLAGGENAVTAYEGYKPLTAEAAVSANPDIILLTTRGLDDAGGVEALASHPGLSLTQAAKNRKIFHMDDLLLLGFGPRLGTAVKELSGLLHGASSPATAGVR